MLGADREGRRDGEVRQAVAVADHAHEVLDGLGVAGGLAEEDVLRCAAGVLGLNLVLEVERAEDVIRVVHGELRGVRVERRGGVFARGLDVGEVLGVDARETV